MSPAQDARQVLERLGVDGTSGELVSFSPIDGQAIGRVAWGEPAAACARASTAFL
jgi:hypothetical protein